MDGQTAVKAKSLIRSELDGMRMGRYLPNHCGMVQTYPATPQELEILHPRVFQASRRQKEHVACQNDEAR